MKNKIIVQEQIITIIEDDYISLTDMVKNIENGLVLIEKWLRNKNTFDFNKNSGTFSCAICNAKPSAIAVFPTPGSPTRIGLFFFLLLNI